MRETSIKKIAEQWSNNSDKFNFSINKKFLQRHVCHFDEINKKDSIWIFSHIPKTAGTSCENYLAQLFLIQNILHINAPDLNKYPEIVSAKKEFPHYLAGHHPMHGLLYQLIPDTKIIHTTLLREPISRIVSYFNYLKSRLTHKNHSEVRDMNFETFCQQPMVEIHNGQSRRLAGFLHTKEIISDTELFESAKCVVDSCFTLVGITEKFESFIKVIESRCGVSIYRSPNKNESKIIVKQEDLDKDQIDILQNNNAADIKLYAYVSKKFNELIESL